MQLYTMPNTSALAATIVVKRLKLPVGIDLLEYGGNRSPAYLKINPIGKVLELLLDSGHSLMETAAILRFLADMAPEAALDDRDPSHPLNT